MEKGVLKAEPEPPQKLREKVLSQVARVEL
jgi:hypothetical protein